MPNDDDGNGQSDGASARTMRFPTAVWSDGIRLVVADKENNRVLVWDTFPTAADGDSHRASRVLGQENFSGKDIGSPSATSLARPHSVDVSAAGELAVADTDNNRVLIWRSIFTSDAKGADFVVGQRDFAHRNRNDVDQRGQDGTVPSAKTLSGPMGVRFHGRDLIVNDTHNNRVLVWREKE